MCLFVNAFVLLRGDIHAAKIGTRFPRALRELIKINLYIVVVKIELERLRSLGYRT